MSRETSVFPTPSGSPKRILLEFSVDKPENVFRNQLVIETNRHIYSSEFGELTKDFYLYL